MLELFALLIFFVLVGLLLSIVGAKFWDERGIYPPNPIDRE